MIIKGIGNDKEIVVNEVDFDPRPVNGGFQLEFPTAIPVINNATKWRYAPSTVWNLGRLPAPGSTQAKKFAISDSTPVVVPQPGERRSWTMSSSLWIGLLMLLVALLVALKFAVSRWRQRN